MDVSSCATRFPSIRVRIPGDLLEGDNEEHQLTIDSATDIVLPVPTRVLSLRRANQWFTPKHLGYIRVVLTIGDKSVSVEVLVVPCLGPDVMIIDNNSIMKAFDAKLDWAAGGLSFRDSNITIPAIR